MSILEVGGSGTELTPSNWSESCAVLKDEWRFVDFSFVREGCRIFVRGERVDELSFCTDDTGGGDCWR